MWKSVRNLRFFPVRIGRKIHNRWIRIYCHHSLTIVGIDYYPGKFFNASSHSGAMWVKILRSRDHSLKRISERREATMIQKLIVSGLHNTSLQVLKIICISLVGPLIALTFCVSFVMCSSERVSSQIQHAVDAPLSESVTPQPSVQVTRTGLDVSTIESYKKVELGESRRLPTGSNDVVCSICLSEYATKESVRCLPECEHCFHTECIDAWLRLHSSCPVCRNNPSPAREGCS